MKRYPFDGMDPCSLTTAEMAVNRLLLQGLSNKAIAKQLVLSVRTVESHVSRSLMKTGCSNRVQLVLWLMDHQEEQP